MKIGVIGLGVMGGALARRLHQARFDVFGYDIDPSVAKAFSHEFHITDDINELAQSVDLVWIMIGHQAVQSVIDQLVTVLSPGTIVIDGGNSFYGDSVARWEFLRSRNIDFLDCGVSGGLRGGTLGFCLMVGGAHEVYERVVPICKALSYNGTGYAYVGPAGAGHYVKMVHNGVEYALMQSYAEGFDLLAHGAYDDIDLEKVSALWNQGSIIRSLLLDLMHAVFERDTAFESISGSVGENGTGRWCVATARAYNVPVTLIEDALSIRLESQKTGGNYATKIVALTRHEMGGHPVQKI